MRGEVSDNTGGRPLCIVSYNDMSGRWKTLIDYIESQLESFRNAPKCARPCQKLLSIANNMDLQFVPFDENTKQVDYVVSGFACQLLNMLVFCCDDVNTYKSNFSPKLKNFTKIIEEKLPHSELIIIHLAGLYEKPDKNVHKHTLSNRIKNDLNVADKPSRYIPVKTIGKDKYECASEIGFQIFNAILDGFGKRMETIRNNLSRLDSHRFSLEWNYLKIFVLNEELAFLHETMGSFRNALEIYNGLELLCSDENSSSFNGHFPKTLCLEYMKPLSLSLCISKDFTWRSKISKNDISGFEFKNYLFWRKTYLSFKLSLWKGVSIKLGSFLSEINSFPIHGYPGIEKIDLSVWSYHVVYTIMTEATKYESFDVYDRLDSEFYDFKADVMSCACHYLMLMSLEANVFPKQAFPVCKFQLNEDFDFDKEGGDIAILVNASKKAGSAFSDVISSTELFKGHVLDVANRAMEAKMKLGYGRHTCVLFDIISTFKIFLGKYDETLGVLESIYCYYDRFGFQDLANSVNIKLAFCFKQLSLTERYLDCCIRNLQYIEMSNVYDFENALMFESMVIHLSKKIDSDVVVDASMMFGFDSTENNYISADGNAEEPFSVEIKVNYLYELQFSVDEIELGMTGGSDGEECVFYTQDYLVIPKENYIKLRSGSRILYHRNSYFPLYLSFRMGRLVFRVDLSNCRQKMEFVIERDFYYAEHEVVGLTAIYERNKMGEMVLSKGYVKIQFPDFQDRLKDITSRSLNIQVLQDYPETCILFHKIDPIAGYDIKFDFDILNPKRQIASTVEDVEPPVIVHVDYVFKRDKIIFCFRISNKGENAIVLNDPIVERNLKYELHEMNPFSIKDDKILRFCHVLHKGQCLDKIYECDIKHTKEKNSLSYCLVAYYRPYIDLLQNGIFSLVRQSGDYCDTCGIVDVIKDILKDVDLQDETFFGTLAGRIQDDFHIKLESVEAVLSSSTLKGFTFHCAMRMRNCIQIDSRIVNKYDDFKHQTGIPLGFKFECKREDIVFFSNNGNKTSLFRYELTVDCNSWLVLGKSVGRLELKEHAITTLYCTFLPISSGKLHVPQLSLHGCSESVEGVEIKHSYLSSSQCIFII